MKTLYWRVVRPGRAGQGIENELGATVSIKEFVLFKRSVLSESTR